MSIGETVSEVRSGLMEHIPESVRPWLPFAPLGLALGGLAMGLMWNWMFLKRIDDFGTRVRLFLVLMLLGALLVLERRVQMRRLGWKWLEDRPGLVAFATLACIGSLFNAYIVYYFQAAASLKMYLFGGVLLFAIAFARVLKERAGGEVMRLVTFLLCSFSLFLFTIPMLTGSVGKGVFASAMFLALLFNALVWLLSRFRFAAVTDGLRNPKQLPQVLHATTLRDVFGHAGAWIATLGGLVLLSAMHAIPPVPLVIMDSGVFHDVERTSEGYVGKYEPHGWLTFYRTDDHPFPLDPGDRVHFFTALFAPSGMDLTVVHRWDRYDDEEGWVTEDRLSFRVTGGRDGGFRGSTRKQSVRPGYWRVVVQTEDGREIGRRRFRIVEGTGGAPTREHLFQ